MKLIRETDYVEFRKLLPKNEKMENEIVIEIASSVKIMPSANKKFMKKETKNYETNNARWTKTKQKLSDE